MNALDDKDEFEQETNDPIFMMAIRNPKGMLKATRFFFMKVLHDPAEHGESKHIKMRRVLVNNARALDICLEAARQDIFRFRPL